MLYEEGVLQSRWKEEVQSLEEVSEGTGYRPGAGFSRVTATGKKLFLNLLVWEQRTL